jgi:hypothetical protein
MCTTLLVRDRIISNTMYTGVQFWHSQNFVSLPCVKGTQKLRSYTSMIFACVLRRHGFIYLFICGLFNELERIWKEVVVVQLDVLFLTFDWRDRGKSRKTSDNIAGLQPRFEPGTSAI